MADSLNGYMYDFNVYTGASGGDRETGLGEKVVLQLAESKETITTYILIIIFHQ